MSGQHFAGVEPAPPSAERPPENVAAEEALLAALLLAGGEGAARSADALKAARETGITASDFYRRERNGRLFEAITAVVARGDPADVLVVEAELRERGWLPAEGDAYARELLASATATSNAPHYATLVVDAARRRDEYEAGHALAAVAVRAGLRNDVELQERLARILDNARAGREP